jgi:hypothetical protein
VAQTFLEPGRNSLILLAIVPPLEWIVRKWSRTEPVFYRTFIAVVAAAAIQCVYFCVAYTWYVMPWYKCLIMVAAALVIARIVYLSSLILEHPKLRVFGYAAVGIIGLWMSLWAAKLADQSVPTAMRAAVRSSLGVGDPRLAKMTSYNQITLSMLDDFFDAQKHTLVAMGDRAGGLGYWGRGSVSVLQLEGLMLDRAYLTALQQHQGEEYLERNFPIEYLVTDREVLPTITAPNGEIEYVVPDPVRGRVTNEPVPTFCFPGSALRYLRRYTTFIGVNTRMAFAFASRVSCPPAALDLVRSIETGIGLQQYSLPSEYDFASAELEDRDRHHRPSQGR